MDETEIERVRKQVKYFFENHIPVYIITWRVNTKTQRNIFWGGEITEVENLNYFVLLEKKRGAMAVFYSQVKDIMAYKEAK